MTELVAQLKADVLPALFKKPAAIGEYGSSPDAQAAMDELGDLMEGAPVTRLATRIGEIVAKLASEGLR